MPDDAGSAPAVSAEQGPRGLIDVAVLEGFRPDVFDYCRALTGRGNVAASATQAALTEARSLLLDSRKLRAWLFALARQEALTVQAAGAVEPASQAVSADDVPDAGSLSRRGGTQTLLAPSREILELVHRHGIQPEDLPSVLALPAAAVEHDLTSVEAELGGQLTAELSAVEPVPGALAGLDSVTEPLAGHAAHVFDYCRALTGREDVAATATQAALAAAQVLLQEPGRLRAWLFALARREALTVHGAGVVEAAFLQLPRFGHQARDVPFPGLISDVCLMDDPGREAHDLVHAFGLDPEALPSVLGVTADEARALLVAAEWEAGPWGRAAKARLQGGAAGAQAVEDDTDAGQKSGEQLADGLAALLSPDAAAGLAGDSARRSGARARHGGSAELRGFDRRRTLAAVAAGCAMAVIGAGIYLAGPSHAARSPSSSKRAPAHESAGPLTAGSRVPPQMVPFPSMSPSPSPQHTVTTVIPPVKKSTPPSSPSPSAVTSPSSSPTTPTTSPTTSTSTDTTTDTSTPSGSTSS